LWQLEQDWVRLNDKFVSENKLLPKLDSEGKASVTANADVLLKPNATLIEKTSCVTFLFMRTTPLKS
jgi:hypothetical protein